MSDRPELAALLADPTRVRDVGPDEVLAYLDALNADEGRRRLVRELLVSRLAEPVVPTSADKDDAVRDVDEVAQLVRRSVSWVRKNGHTLPGFRQPGGKGTRVEWSRTALLAWANGRPLV